MAEGVAPGGTLLLVGQGSIDPATEAPTMAAGQVQVSVEEVVAALDQRGSQRADQVVTGALLAVDPWYSSGGTVVGFERQSPCSGRRRNSSPRVEKVTRRLSNVREACRTSSRRSSSAAPRAPAR